MNRRSIITVIFIALAGCSSGPRAVPIDTPSSALQGAYDESVDDPLIAYTDALSEDWWNLFDDRQLSEFILAAYARNPTVQEARANILLAAYNADLVRSALYPNINWGADVLREKFSQTGIIPFNTTGQTTGTPPIIGAGGVAGIPVYFTQYETEFILTYDFDIWGKRRSLLRSALGEVQSNIADEIFVRLEIGTAVAQTYFQLQIDYKRLEIALEQVEVQQQLFALTQDRFDANIDNEFALNLAEAGLAQAQRGLEGLRGDVAVNEHRLKAYLAGNFDEVIGDIHVDAMPLPRVPLPGDLPLHLIAHRPDVISQLWLIESAGQQIEAAKAGFYPDLSITALYGYQTIHFKKLFEWPSTYFSADPSLLLPVFDGGRLIANLRGSEVTYDQAIYEYNRLVLNAVKEVLDGISILRYNERQLNEYRRIAVLDKRNLELTTTRVDNNLSSDLDLLQSKSNALSADDQELVALGNTLQSIVALIKALGGGYNVCYE